MEGQSVISSKIRFLETGRKIRISQNVQTSLGCNLVAAANSHNLLVVGSDDNSIKAIPMDQVTNVNQSQTNKSEIVNYDSFVFKIQLTFRPTLLTMAKCGFSPLLLVTGLNAMGQPVIEVLDLDMRNSIGQVQLNKPAEIVDHAWHPNYSESIASLCTNHGDLLVLAVDRKVGMALVYNSPEHQALSCCWSPKGKNLAVGMIDGRVKRLEPVLSGASGFAFKEVDKSTLRFKNPKMTPSHRVVRLRWINKTHLMSVHAIRANPAGPEAIYSVFTVKASAQTPYKYWTSVCFESQNVPEPVYYVANFTNAIVCGSNASGEAAVIGVDGDEWKAILIDEEGARIELPLDSNNTETYPRGLTVASSQDNLVLIYYTSAGIICSYLALNPEKMLLLPEIPPTQVCPLQVNPAPRPAAPAPILSAPMPAPTPAPTLTLAPSKLTLGAPSLTSLGLALPGLNLAPPTTTGLNLAPPTKTGLNLAAAPIATPLNLAQQPIATPLNLAPPKLNQPTAQPSGQQTAAAAPPPPPATPAPGPAAPVAKADDRRNAIIKKVDLSQDIAAVKKGMEFNSTFLSILDDVNHLRKRLEEIQELHKIHREALDAIANDIGTLDAGMLENLYLIEYIKTHSIKQTKKRYLDPTTQSKVEQIRSQTEELSKRLKDLNIHVDIQWADFVKRKTGQESKSDPLGVIYRTLATHQKIINALKRKAALVPVTSKESFQQSDHLPPVKQANPAWMYAFREFLASRNNVPVRRPD